MPIGSEASGSVSHYNVMHQYAIYQPDVSKVPKTLDTGCELMRVQPKFKDMEFPGFCGYFFCEKAFPFEACIQTVPLQPELLLVHRRELLLARTNSHYFPKIKSDMIDSSLLKQCKSPGWNERLTSNADIFVLKFGKYSNPNGSFTDPRVLSSHPTMNAIILEIDVDDDYSKCPV